MTLRRLATRPGHRATTATFQAVYPFVAEGGLGGNGVYIGRDLYGGSFAYDPFALYEQRVLTNPNMLVIGEVGSGKSSLIKTYLLRQALFGAVRIPRDQLTAMLDAAIALAEDLQASARKTNGAAA